MGSDYRGEQAAEVAIVFLALSWTTVLLRVYVRTFLTKSFGLDDWFGIASLLLFTFYSALVLDGVHYGTGRHLTEVGPINFVIGMKAWWIAEIGYVSCTTTLKLSISFFLLRVCVKKTQRYIIWVVTGAVTLFSLFYFFLIIFQCRPVGWFWNQYDIFRIAKGETGHCVSASMVAGSTYTHSALSALADWTLALLPIWLVWDLNMNPRTKVSVALILAMGALGSTATVVRIPYIYQLTRTKDFLYANVDISIWSTVEPGIGITASSMATLRPLFVNFFSRSKLMGSSTRQESAVWPRSASRKGYFRSGGNDNRGTEELGLTGLRSDLQKGSGVSTTIQSMNDIRSSEEREEREKSQREKSSPTENGPVDEAIKRVQRFGSGLGSGRRKGSISTKALKGPSGTWNSNESHLTEDSSSEEGIAAPDNVRLKSRLEVIKTTEVTYTREWAKGTPFGESVSGDRENSLR